MLSEAQFSKAFHRFLDSLPNAHGAPWATGQTSHVKDQTATLNLPDGLRFTLVTAQPAQKRSPLSSGGIGKDSCGKGVLSIDGSFSWLSMSASLDRICYYLGQ
jgi:hypothetical protein